MTKRLFYNMRTAWDVGIRVHPQANMRSLGVAYYHSMPQPLYDGWDFWCCENMPAKLPPYLTVPKSDNPMEFVKHGLPVEAAILIIERIQSEKTLIPHFPDGSGN